MGDLANLPGRIECQPSAARGETASTPGGHGVWQCWPHTVDGQNPFRTTMKPYHCLLAFSGESSFQGLLGCAGFSPSTVFIHKPVYINRRVLLSGFSGPLLEGSKRKLVNIKARSLFPRKTQLSQNQHLVFNCSTQNNVNNSKGGMRLFMVGTILYESTGF